MRSESFENEKLVKVILITLFVIRLQTTVLVLQILKIEPDW